ncbi:MAG: peptidase C25, partial [Aestuariibaculum sp.]
MKRGIFLLFLLLNLVLYGQQKSFNIEWESDKTIFGDSYSFVVPSFNEEFFSYSPEEGVRFVTQWKAMNVDESSVQVTNVVYAPILKGELGSLDVDVIPNKLEFSLNNSKARGTNYVFFKLSPIINTGGSNYKKVVAFTLNYKEGNSAAINRKSISKTRKQQAVSNSVLATGRWYKFYIDTTGVFRLTKNFLSRLGVDVNNVDPRNIRLYGNGGDMIPYLNSEYQPFDVVENAIKFVGEEDGVFNNEDYILFYGRGPKGYNAESKTNINCYTDKTYYYINVGTGYGKRIQTMFQPSGVPTVNINTFNDYQFHEVDTYNIGFLGRRWFGERFDIESEQIFEFDFPNLQTASPIELQVYVASTGAASTSMEISVNGAQVSSLSIPG